MKNTNEIAALLSLLDDPDQEVLSSVTDKLVNFGKDIVPNLEDLWEKTNDLEVQERIEQIIHKVNFNDVFVNIQQWHRAEKPCLLYGSILLARYRYPSLNEDTIRRTIKSIYQSCWLELNNYLTPLEQINIINSIFFNVYKFQSVENTENKPSHFFINEVIDSHIGIRFR
jgi:hypothetical protein